MAADSVPVLIASLQNSTTRADTASLQMYKVANGPATGPTSSVSTDSGPVPTLAKFFADNQAAITEQANLRGELASTTPGDGTAMVLDRYDATGAVDRTQRAINADTISLRAFGAAGDGVTVDTSAVQAAEAAATLRGTNNIYMPPGVYLVDSNFAFTKTYYGPGVFSYFGIGAVTFIGPGLNDFELAGPAYRGQGVMSVIVEITNGTTNPNQFRFSVDGGTTWISQSVTILPDDSEVITPLVVTTSLQPLGQTGVQMRWGALTGHTVGNRWTFALRPNPKVTEIGRGLTANGQLVFHSDGNRNLSVGQNSGSPRNASFEQISFGNDCNSNNQSGYGTVAMGNRASQLSTTGFLRTCIGTWAGRDGNGNGDTFVGAYAGVNAPGGSGGYNTGIGNDALTFPWNGTENTAIGVQAGHGNDETRTGWNPIRNTMGGTQCMRDLENAAYCSVWGAFSAVNARSVQALTSVGYGAFGNLTTGNNNTGLGVQAGTTITTGETNLFLGYYAGNNALQKVDAVNSIAIGANTFNTANNQIVIGNVAHTDIFFYGNLKPQTDNAFSAGAASARFTTVYALTGAINTSDERKKTFADVTEKERRVALACKSLIRKFRWNDAIEIKGDSARWHFGVGAQSVQKAFAAEGLDASEYGLFCYDEWPDEWVEWKANPEADPPIEAGRKLIRAAGNLYGVRYDELCMFILSAI